MIYFVTFSNQATTNITKRYFAKEHKKIVNGRIHCFNFLNEVYILVYLGILLVIPSISKKGGIIYI
jgi:hypothetical protein